MPATATAKSGSRKAFPHRPPAGNPDDPKDTADTSVDTSFATRVPFLGAVEDLAEIVERSDVDEVILTPEGSSWRDRLSERIPEGWRADLLVWPSPFETMIGRLRFRIVGDLPLLEARTQPLQAVGAFAKRSFDVIVSAVLLVLLAPVLAIAALLVVGTSIGGVFYRQTRVGREGHPFELWKLRTMRRGAEIETGAILASPGDPRMTEIGRALRSARPEGGPPRSAPADVGPR